MNRIYYVKKCSHNNAIDADWNKLFWHDVKPIPVRVSNWVEPRPATFPQAEVKLQYDDSHIYVIFRVRDRYVKAVTTQIHGPVYKDSCVEFFFSPNRKQMNAYFNIEINCCGTILAQYHTGPRKNSRFLNNADCRKIQVASTSGPIQIEIKKPMTWTVEYAIPLEILLHYMEIEKPAPGICWRGNFYKCADASSFPHWISWLPISGKTPDFHRPDCFGLLEFI